ncbi:MAG TPA: glycoside hydrolase family 38 C-terminal domain-containing protein [Streptosporangiaceae bacterium]
MRISAVSSTDLFTGTAARPLQIVRVSLVNDGPGLIRDPAAVVRVEVTGGGVSTPEPARLTGLQPGAEVVAEIGVQVAMPAAAGSVRQVSAVASGQQASATARGQLVIAEPGWTMWMVSHFHYDPVWWSTQGQFLQTRLLLPADDGAMPETRTAFELVALHLDAARQDADYKFVLAELDYLKPHFDAHPEDRDDLLELIRCGRIEIVGGSYNEPNTNLTSAESTIRNAVYGLGYQRDVLGAEPRTAWMLDAFGFDPGYPGLMAAAGMRESAWARGPFHQWGPGRSAGDNRLMQFPSEFEWLSPDGAGLLTSYMANHYGAGWITQQAATLPAAEQSAYQQFTELAAVAPTPNVLLPVGGDHVIPSRWATAIHRDWNARYLWPRFVTAVPSEFFAAVREAAASRGSWLMPQTRDMNPVYTGKDVSYIDTKQAQRAAETAVLDGERLGTLAWLAGASYPAASLDKAWRQLVFGAHHDAITGTEGDQVYLDLLAGWREAYERGDQARRDAARYLAGLADTAAAARQEAGGWRARDPDASSAGQGALTAVAVINTLSFARSAMASVTVGLTEPGTPWLELRDETGALVPFLAEGVRTHPDGSLAALTATFRAADVPALGYRTLLAWPARAPLAGETGRPPGGWAPAPSAAGDGVTIENEAFLVQADPARGGTLRRVLDKRSGAELLAGDGNELLLQPEYPAHPRWREGPWLLCPAGPGEGTASRPARVRAERSPAGQRLVAELSVGDLRVTQETLLWDGAGRIEFRTHVDGSIGQDRLLRVRFPAAVPGGLPVYQTAVSVIGRPFGDTDTDVAEHSYTLDNPAHEWFGLGSTARLALTGPGGRREHRALGVAEVIAPADEPAGGADQPGGQPGPAGLAGFAPAAAVTSAPCRAAVGALMAALARQGVTATCTVPDGPRCGLLEVDSNLPDFRIALGGPDRNSFTARLLSQTPAAAAELRRQLAAGGTARVWVPAARSRQEAFAPGADLRPADALPVLIVDDAAGLADAIQAVAADLADAVIEVSHDPAGGAEPAGGGQFTEPDLAGHSVALLNRGTPGSLVTPAGVLNISLMRACSTWPCGVWIDGDKRATPDGSSFAWQHWSHTFEYALAAGPGDWRTAGFPLAGQDYNHDLLTCLTGIHDGQLPAAASLASAQPATALISALKPAGNPLAPLQQPSPADGLTVRLRDVSGGAQPAQARLRLLAPVRTARLTGICEDTDGELLSCPGGQVTVSVPAAGTATLTAVPGPVPALEPAAGPAQPLPEPAQPVFTRYWLHGKGPAPAGNLPVAVHLSPGRVPLSPGAAARLRLTVACGPKSATGIVQLDVPAGLSVQPAGPLRYDLPGLGHASWELTVRPAGAPAAGRYFVAAQITDAAGQRLEDAALVAVGEPADPALTMPAGQLAPQLAAPEQATAAEIDLRLLTPRLALAPGWHGQIRAVLANRTAAGLRGEAQLVSPFGSWAQTAPWTTGFSVPAGAETELAFSVAGPAAARPGQHWWALIKVMYFGRLAYTEPVRVSVPD